MAQRYELVEGTSSKFWEIELAGSKFMARWGRIGTAGQEKQQSFASASEAKKAHDKMIADKTKKGYTLVSGGAKAAASSAATKTKAPAAAATKTTAPTAARSIRAGDRARRAPRRQGGLAGLRRLAARTGRALGRGHCRRVQRQEHEEEGTGGHPGARRRARRHGAALEARRRGELRKIAPENWPKVRRARQGQPANVLGPALSSSRGAAAAGADHRPAAARRR